VPDCAGVAIDPKFDSLEVSSLSVVLGVVAAVVVCDVRAAAFAATVGV
jgi:hypothetical protein